MSKHEWEITYNGVQLHIRRLDTGHHTISYKFGSWGLGWVPMSCCVWAEHTGNYEYCDTHRSAWPMEDELKELDFDVET